MSQKRLQCVYVVSISFVLDGYTMVRHMTETAMFPWQAERQAIDYFEVCEPDAHIIDRITVKIP